MNKSILADQFLGAAFASMVEHGVYEIPFSQLYKLEKIVDKALRDSHNAMLLFSSNDILTIIDAYSDLFSIQHDTISLSSTIISGLTEDTRRKEHVIKVFHNYFTSGIPCSINSTLTAILNEEF